MDTKTPEDTLANLNFGTPDLPMPMLSMTNGEKALAEATPESPVTLSTEEQENLYAEAANLKAAREAIDERLDQIKAAFRALDYGTQTVHKEAEGKVTVGHNPVFNEARALVQYPYDEEVIEDTIVERDGKKVIEPVKTYPNRDLYKIALDRPAMKRLLIEDDYKALFDEGAKKITIK